MKKPVIYNKEYSSVRSIAKQSRKIRLLKNSISCKNKALAKNLDGWRSGDMQDAEELRSIERIIYESETGLD